MNKEERKNYNKNYDKLHKENRRKRQYEYKKRVRVWLIDYKVLKGCKNCGEKHPACLDFHHRNPNDKKLFKDKKVFGFSGLLNRGCGKGRLMEEVAKCDVLCSNCHRKLHWEERIDEC